MTAKVKKLIKANEIDKLCKILSEMLKKVEVKNKTEEEIQEELDGIEQAIKVIEKKIDEYISI